MWLKYDFAVCVYVRERAIELDCMQGSPGTVAAHAHQNGYQHSGGVNLIVKTIIKCGWCQLLLLLLFIIVFLLIVFCSSEPYVASLVKACVRNRYLFTW